MTFPRRSLYSLYIEAIAKPGRDALPRVHGHAGRVTLPSGVRREWAATRERGPPVVDAQERVPPVAVATVRVPPVVFRGSGLCLCSRWLRSGGGSSLPPADVKDQAPLMALTTAEHRESYPDRRARIKRDGSFVGRLTTEYTETPLTTRIWLEKSRLKRKPAHFNTIEAIAKPGRAACPQPALPNSRAGVLQLHHASVSILERSPFTVMPPSATIIAPLR